MGRGIQSLLHDPRTGGRRRHRRLCSGLSAGLRFEGRRGGTSRGTKGDAGWGRDDTTREHPGARRRPGRPVPDVRRRPGRGRGPTPGAQAPTPWSGSPLQPGSGPRPSSAPGSRSACGPRCTLDVSPRHSEFGQHYSEFGQHSGRRGVRDTRRPLALGPDHVAPFDGPHAHRPRHPPHTRWRRLGCPPALPHASLRTRRHGHSRRHTPSRPVCRGRVHDDRVHPRP